MSTEALGSALSGLRVAQKGLDLTANNISNASTAGYTRKTLPQESVWAGGANMGVRFGEIQRHVDSALQNDYRIQLGVDARLDTRQAFLSRLVAAQGATETQMNIGAQIGALYGDFVALSAAPDNKAAQNTAVSQAKRIAGAFGALSSQVNDMRNDIQKTIGNEVRELNVSLGQIADYNKRIATMASTGSSTATLEDQRDELVKKVAQQLDVTYYTDGSGILVLQSKQGQVLVDTEARPIEFDTSVVNATMLYPTSVGGLIIKDNVLGGTDLAAGSPGGKLGALLELRDKDLPKYNAQLDELAYKMMVRFNDQGLRLFTDHNGVVPPNDPAVYAGIAGRMQVNPLILADSGLLQRGTTGGSVAAGSNAVITKIIDYTFGKYKDAANTPNEPFAMNLLGFDRNITITGLVPPDATLQDFATSFLNSLAQDYNSAKSEYEVENRYTAEVEKRLTDNSAVNTDEEMANMIVLQKAYTASAKMVSALDELFRDLLNAIR